MAAAGSQVGTAMEMVQAFSQVGTAMEVVQAFSQVGTAMEMVQAFSQVGTAMEVVQAFSQVEQLISDIKTLVPGMHQALNSSISQLTVTMGDIIDQIGQVIDPTV